MRNISEHYAYILAMNAQTGPDQTCPRQKPQLFIDTHNRGRAEEKPAKFEEHWRIIVSVKYLHVDT